jgi:hypothetical protein
MAKTARAPINENKPESVAHTKPTKTAKRLVEGKREKKRGDTPALIEWRQYYKKWCARHPDVIKGKPQSARTKLAGIAYRHQHEKKRPEDPATPEFL